MRAINLLAKVFFFIVICGFASFSHAQVVAGDVVLSTQEEVNSFSGTSIEGSLTIQGSDIVDLSTLFNLDSVGGTLRITNNDSLNNLDDLTNLVKVNQSVLIMDNPTLSSLIGLSNLGYIGNDLAIANNDTLQTLGGLNNLNSVGMVEIVSNASLTTLDGLSGLESATDFNITSNPSLQNLDGLENITSFVYYLWVDFNDALINVNGLSNIDSIFSLWIASNESLTNLDGLSNLSVVEAELLIEDNVSLSRYCGLYNLLATNGDQGWFSLSGNGYNPSRQQIIDDGPCIVQINRESKPFSDGYRLDQNYPNPFNPTTTITYSVRISSQVEISIFNISGKEVFAIQEGLMEPGEYKVLWSGTDNLGNQVDSGLYFCTLVSDSHQKTIKMVYLQ